MKQEEILKTIKSRRSIRQYANEPISDEEIRAILDCARFAPSASNSQPWRFAVIRDAEMIAGCADIIDARAVDIAERMKSAGAKRNFTEYSKYFTFFRNAPVVIAVYGVQADTLLTRMLKRYTPEFGDGFRRDNVLISVSTAIQNILLAADAVGLGATPLTSTMFATDEIDALIDADESWELIGIIALGKPLSAKSDELPERKPLDEIVCWK